jgi:hypothetical protein
MPRIKEYSPQVTPTDPQVSYRPSGDDVGGVAGGFARAGAGLADAGEYLFRRAEQAEVSDVSKKLADMHAEFTTQLDESIRKPSKDGTNLVTNLLQKYDDKLDEVRDGVSTPAGANHLKSGGAQLRAHFVEASMRGQADLAGARDRENYTGALNTLSSSLITNPSAFQSVLELHASNLEALVQSGGLPAVDAMKLKTYGEKEIAKSAVLGRIKQNPDMAIGELEAGVYDKYMEGDMKAQLLNAARVAKERGDSDDDRARKEAQIAEQNKFLELLSKNQLTVDQILTAKALEPFGSGSKEQFLQLLQHHNKEGIQTNPALMIDLFQRIHADENDSTKLRDENDLNRYFGQGLTLDNVKELRSEIQGRRTIDGEIEGQLKKQVMEVARGRLSKTNPILGIQDPAGDEQVLKFLSFFLRTYSEQKKAGKSPFDLLSNPKSPDYLLNHLNNYERTPQQIIRDLVKYSTEGPGGMAEPQTPSDAGVTAPPESKPSPSPSSVPSPPQSDKVRRAGENPAQYLKRIRGE